MSSQYGATGSASGSQSVSSFPAGSQRAIESRMADFVAAWNKHDAAAMAAMWAADGDMINPWGRVAKGRDQVQQLFREEHQGPFKSCSHQMSITSIRPAGDDVAIVDADCTLSGARGPDGKEIPTFKPHVVFVMSNQSGDWQIIAARPYMYAPKPGTNS